MPGSPLACPVGCSIWQTRCGGWTRQGGVTLSNSTARSPNWRDRSASIRRCSGIRPPGGNPPRACARTSKIAVSSELRSRRLAGVFSGRHGRGMGHGSRRTYRPGNARPSQDERRFASDCGGAGANRVHLAESRASAARLFIAPQPIRHATKGVGDPPARGLSQGFDLGAQFRDSEVLTIGGSRRDGGPGRSKFGLIPPRPE